MHRLAVFALLFAQQPVTRTDNFKETLHGVEIADPYRWLEDQTSPETRAWLDAQNAYTHSVLAGYTGRDKIKARLLALSKTDRVEPPFARGGRYFFRKRLADQEQYLVVLREASKPGDQLLIDPTAAKDVNTSADILDVTMDGKLMAYGIREGGQDEVLVKVQQVDTRENLRDVLPKGRYLTVSFIPDKSGLFYTKSGDENPRVYEHKFGQDAKNDKAIFGEGYGAQHLIATTVSDDGHYLVIEVLYGSSADQVDVYVKDLKAGGAIRPLVKGVKAGFSSLPGGDLIYVKTDYKASRGRILAIDPKNPAESNWKEVIPETAAPMESFRAIGGKLYVTYLEDVKSRLKVFDANGKFLHEIALPGIGSVGGPYGDWTGNELFYTFTSFHVPPEIRRIDLTSGKETAWFRTSMQVQPENFDLRQVFYKSKDGTRIPMFLLSGKNVKPNGNLPVLLTGYGGFTVNMTPALNSTAILWAEAGGVFAVPNLRGGAEYGEEWHKAGMLGNKQNVFDDFIAAAEWLIANKYTTPKRLAIAGGSNGGLLVGAAMTQRPELFQAVACQVPLLDMIRYHKFLVAKFWVPEYGSSDDAKQFPYLLKYSPYQNVKKGVDYPATIFMTGDGDTRVAPLHARKMAALVQANTSGKRPILLHYDTKAGHSAGMSVTKQAEDSADKILFLLTQVKASAADAGAVRE